MNSAFDIVRFLKPKPCPVPLVRIGGDRDGAYLVPDDMADIAACFSPGVANRKTFEDELQGRYGIPAHMCDFSSDPGEFATPMKPGQTFEKKWLGTTDDAETLTLASWVEDKVPGESDLLLQMDIEGAEYPTIRATSVDTLRRFRVIVMELHRLGQINKEIPRNRLLSFFAQLEPHFHCVHLHPNNCNTQIQVGNTGNWLPKVLEVTLMRKDRFDGASEFIAPRMPHPLDIEFNVRRKPPQAMGLNWSR